jgi:hypothetical protein
LQWLQDPSEISGDNLKNVRREASRYIRNKKREYLKDKINETATNSKKKNIRDLYRGIKEFKREYQPRNNLEKDKNGNLQIDVHTAVPLEPDPSRLEVGNAIAKLKKYKSPRSDIIPAELISAGSEILLSDIHKLINSVWNKEELPDQWMESIIVPIHKMGDKTDCNNYRGLSLLSTSYKIVWNILFSKLGPYMDEIIGDHRCGFQHKSNY